MQNILLLYGGIGDTIMIYEILSFKKPDLIYANELAYKTLIALNCNIPLKRFKLRLSPKPLKKVLYLFHLIRLYISLLLEKKSNIIVPSFSKFWLYLPTLK